MIQKKQTSETIRMLILLCIIGGITDTYTYFVRGKVFVNAHTGNIIYLTMYMSTGNWKKVISYLIPILVFSLGIFTAEFLKDYQKNIKKYNLFHWRQLGLFFQIVIFIIISFIPQGSLDIYVNTILSFVSALQYQSFKKTHGNFVATTMCTGNLRSGIEFFYKGIIKGNYEDFKKTLIYFGAIFFFFIGCFISVLGIHLFSIFNKSEKTILLCIPFAVSALIFMNNKYSYNRKLIEFFLNLRKKIINKK